MRTELINQFADLNATESGKLTMKEVATSTNAENVKPVFTTANLWNIHNMKRTRLRGRAFGS